MTIDLAPHHKQGLPVENPVLLAGGAVGYGEAKHAGLDLARLGAVVVGPIMRRSTRGAELARVAEISGGMVLETGLQNRGVSAVIKRFARLWPKFGCPVITQIVDSQPELAGQVAARLAMVTAVSGLELLVPRHADANLVSQIVRAVDCAADLPIWVKLPLENLPALAGAAVDAGASGLVIGQPLRGAGLSSGSADPSTLVRGPVYGPLAFAPMLAALADVAALNLPVALIACGGIHTPAQARQVLAAGAQALQLDSVVWIEPGMATHIVEGLAGGT